MANTYTLIQAQTLASAAATVTFSSIPATYTDLVLRVSARSNRVATTEYVTFTLNASASGYSETDLNGNGTAASSSRGTAGAAAFLGIIPAASNTASTFANGEIYIPSYTASQNKQIGTFDVSEGNSASTGVWIQTFANLWSNTAAITSIALTPQSGGSFVTDSSFYLYGIKNS